MCTLDHLSQSHCHTGRGRRRRRRGFYSVVRQRATRQCHATFARPIEAPTQDLLLRHGIRRIAVAMVHSNVVELVDHLPSDRGSSLRTACIHSRSHEPHRVMAHSLASVSSGHVDRILDRVLSFARTVAFGSNKPYAMTMFTGAKAASRKGMKILSPPPVCVLESNTAPRTERDINQS